VLGNFPMSQVIFSSSSTKESKKISKLLKTGSLRKIAPRIYTSDFSQTPEQIIRNHIFEILEHFYPNSVLSHRSAFEVKPLDDILILSGKKRSKVILPGTTLYFVDERSAHPKDVPFLGLFIAHEARAYLENLTRTRHEEGTFIKNLSREAIEKRLLQKLEAGGEEALNKLRDEAKSYSEEANLKQEYLELQKIIGALLGTKDAKNLSNSRSIAFLKGEDYDEERFNLFSEFFIFLKDLPLNFLEDPKMANPAHFRNKAFFESYFSNYIEGTEFEIEEAEEIIFDKKASDRPKDAHDILGTFEIVSDAGEMRRIPKDASELIELLKARHLSLMANRPEVLPGKWKEKNNRAGNTYFVDYKKVEGTLKKVFRLVQGLAPGFPRAAFMMLLVTEVHPFTDGNGRIARIMLNAELESKGLGSIIIPNSFREDYLLALKAASKQQRFDPYVRMLIRALKFSNMIDFSDYQKSRNELIKRNWFLLPSEGKIIDV
jgi:hypothetical protein